MLTVSFTTEQKVQVTLNPATATGKAAKVDGAPKWTVTDGDVTLDVAADGLSAYIIAGETAAVAHVTVDADADLGKGVADISDIIEATVTGEQAAQLGLAAAAPVPK